MNNRLFFFSKVARLTVDFTNCSVIINAALTRPNQSYLPTVTRPIVFAPLKQHSLLFQDRMGNCLPATQCIQS